MENQASDNIIGFLKNKVEAYFKIIGTDDDTEKKFIDFFSLLEEYQKNLHDPDELDFLSTIQNALFEKNDIDLRKESARFLQVLFGLNVSNKFIIERWNAFYSNIQEHLIKNPYQKRREKIKNPFIFSCYFDREIDDFAEPIDLIIERDLFLGDIIDFSDHEYDSILIENYKTLTFKIVKRHYSVQYNEMYLHLESWYE